MCTLSVILSIIFGGERMKLLPISQEVYTHIVRSIWGGEDNITLNIVGGVHSPVILFVISRGGKIILLPLSQRA